MGLAQAMKRIPRIKFPQRHPKPSVLRLLQLWEAKLLFNPKERLFPMRKLRLFCWVDVSDHLMEFQQGR
ncbi:ribosomal rna large subunit methyltransferase m [Gossypium arboreum]|uniref:Ribosomal rna large subunit methyltransferase m n=1 Tax=Gossypium arboreum TaxID=29729 RepID=A0A0B0MAK4_GOSAR|nr:ribosomal rna large subunit methyltransferase m [Gossypium arboreum]